MKIIGVSFGTKDGANDSMCRTALLAAQEEGAEIGFIHLHDWDIKYCTGCVACSRGLTMGHGNVCILKDDFDDFRSILLDADGVLFVSPIFEKGGPGLLHSVCDRFGPRLDRGMNVMADQRAKAGEGKPVDPRILKDKVISFIGIGGSDWSTRIQCDQHMIALSPGWKVIDNDRFSWSKQIIMEDDKVARIREIGRNLAKAAADIESAKYMGAPGLCTHCNCNEFYLDPNSSHAICCLCGIEGELEVVGGKLRFVYPESQVELAHDTLSGKLIHGRDIYEMESKNMGLSRSEEFKNRVAAVRDAVPIIPPPAKK